MVKLKGEDGKENPFNPIDMSQKSSNVSSNVREGLFGTALSESDDGYHHKIARADPVVIFSDGIRKPFGKKSRPSQPPKKSVGFQRERQRVGEEADSRFLDSELDRYMKK